MLNAQQTEIQKQLRELLERTPPPQWLSDMIDHYRRTGSYRPEDLRRVLGDPTKGVTVGPDLSLEAILASVMRSCQ